MFRTTEAGHQICVHQPLEDALALIDWHLHELELGFRITYDTDESV